MQKKKDSINIKSFFSDSVWSILALVLMNIIVQFIVYPFWSKQYSNEEYGNIVYIISIINIFAISFGSALNYTRMVDSSTRNTKNGDYNIVICFLSIIAALSSVVISRWSIYYLSVIDSVLICFLCITTVWRVYADVEYRLSLNYRGYFVYYALISVGYIIGIAIFQITKLWPLTLLPGEIFGLIYIWKKGCLFTEYPLTRSTDFSKVIRTSAVLIFTNLISNIVFNGDRLLLQNVLGGASVTVYYLASLVGKTMTLITTPLNSVMIGYLAKIKNNFAYKHVLWLIAGTFCAISIATIGSLIGSHIIIGLLYPDNYEKVKPFFLLANFAQIIYFITNVVTTFLLRISSAKTQLVINIVYVICFIVLCFPATFYYGIWGFCVGLLTVNILRYLLSIIFCFSSIGTSVGKSEDL